MGVAYNKLAEYDEAINAFDFCIAIEEAFSSAYFNKANALANQEKYEEAIEVYKQTFEYEEPDAYTHYYLGECYEKLGK